jgi:hypothetical protein
MNGMPGVNSTANVNVHSLALQVPITQLVSGGKLPTSKTAANAVIGVWTSASRRKVRINDSKGGVDTESGPYTQVSRMGNPLVNELLIAIDDKDKWNQQPPTTDGTTFFKYFANPLLADLLPVLYPGVFPHLAAYNAAHTGTTKANAARPDLVAILLSGIPNSVTSGLGAPPTNVGGAGLADHLHLNVAQPPTAPGSANNLGYLGADPAGFPNGRRVFDDVATIALRAVAGATLPLVAPTYSPDGAAGAVDFSLTSGGSDNTAMGTEHYLTSFPYLGTPYSGFTTPARQLWRPCPRRVASERSSSTSAVRWARQRSMCPPRSPVTRSRSVPSVSAGAAPTSPCGSECFRTVGCGRRCSPRWTRADTRFGSRTAILPDRSVR